MILATDAQRFSDALSSAGAGETISLNAGTYVAPRGGFVIGKSVRIGGTHPLRNRIEGGTIVVPASPDDHAFRIETGNVRISDLIVRGPSKPGRGDGFHLEHQGTLACVELERLMVWGVGRDGIHIEPHGGSVNLLELKSCIANHNGRHGLYVASCFGIAVTGGYYAGNGRCGIALDACDVAALWHTAAENNQSAGATGDYEPQIYVRNSAGSNLDSCVVEDFAGGGARAALTVEGGVGIRVTGCTFTNPTTAASRGIVFRGGSRSCLVDLNTWVRVTQPFDIDASCKDVTTRPQAVKTPAS